MSISWKPSDLCRLLSNNCLLTQVRLGITSAEDNLQDGDDGPEFVESVQAMVAAGAATFNPGPIVKWDKRLKQDGEVAVVDATLCVGPSECVGVPSAICKKHAHSMRSVCIFQGLQATLCGLVVISCCLF